VVAALGLLVAPGAADGQEPGKISRVGFLGSRNQSDNTYLDTFRRSLQDLGWVEGKNLVIERRFAEGRLDRLPEFAAELVRLKVDVIVVGGTAPAVAARKATATVPIVVVAAGDPVALGLAKSLARPGGNVTGLSFDVALQLIPKELELLKETVPRARRIAVLSNPANPGNRLAIDNLKSIAGRLGVQLQFLEAQEPAEFENAFAAMSREGAEALFVVPDATLAFQRARLQEFVAKSRLPTMFGLREHAEVGGLMSYTVDLQDIFRRAATYVDKILRGAKASELPIEQPSKYELVINLKTAKALGLTIPQSILARADRVIR